MLFSMGWEMEGLGKESTPAAVSDTSFYSCNTSMCSHTEGAALFTKKGKEAANGKNTIQLAMSSFAASFGKGQ